MFFLFHLLLGLPFPVGYYSGHYRVPFSFRGQRVELIVEQNRALLNLSGYIDATDYCTYTRFDDGTYTCALGDVVKRALERKRCELLTIGYDDQRDVALITIRTPIGTSAKIELGRDVSQGCGR
tara:strand:+ start:7223 stop:7594 length:372 start_codon:yes stop_codon:yes gene_type:complete